MKFSLKGGGSDLAITHSFEYEVPENLLKIQKKLTIRICIEPLKPGP
jgi:hypothetical protein